MQPVWCHLYLSTMLLLASMIPEFVQKFLGGAGSKAFRKIQQHIEHSTQNFEKIQVSGSALGKTIKNNTCPVVILGYTLISVDPAFRIPGDLRPARVEVMG